MAILTREKIIDARTRRGELAHAEGRSIDIIAVGGAATERAYQLVIDAKKATLSEAARAKREDRLLHDQELGVPVDPTASAVIWWPRADRGQSTERGFVPPAALPNSAQTAKVAGSRNHAVHRGSGRVDR